MPGSPRDGLGQSWRVQISGQTAFSPLEASPGASLVAQPANSGDAGLIPGSGRSPGEGNGNPLQCSCLENPMDRGAWWATVCGVAKESDKQQQHHQILTLGPEQGLPLSLH